MAKVVTFLIIFSLFLPPSQILAEETCTSLVLTRCESCHYNTRICQKLGKKSRSSWKRSVKNMVRYGAKLNKKEQKKLIRCLSKPSEEIVLMCK